MRYKLPRSWKEITIQQYVRLDAIINSELSDTDKDIEVIAELSGLTYSQVLELPIKYKRKALQRIQFLHKLPNTKFKRRFTLKGRTFLIPKFKNITGGQYIDMMSFCERPDATTQGIHNILACVCQPARLLFWTKKYDGKEHPRITQFLFEYMPISIAYPILVFFCNLYDNLMKDIQLSLTKEMEKMKIDLQQVITTEDMPGS